MSVMNNVWMKWSISILTEDVNELYIMMEMTEKIHYNLKLNFGMM